MITIIIAALWISCWGFWCILAHRHGSSATELETNNFDVEMVYDGRLISKPNGADVYEPNKEDNLFLNLRNAGLHLDATSDPYQLSLGLCQTLPRNCMYLAVNYLEREQARQFQLPLPGWIFDPLCNSMRPPRLEKLPYIQFMHIPKTGTSINWALHGYFDCDVDELTPCPISLRNKDERDRGLCDGRLFSCAGHVVSSLVGNATIANNANMFTMLRHPLKRLISSYQYLSSNPSSNMLEPYVNTSQLLQYIHSPPESRATTAVESESDFIRFVKYPGIANCMTKMLNGYQCGEDVAISESHLQNAQRVISAFAGFGITEHFKSSVCLFYWMYGGGTVKQSYFGVFREGNYSKDSAGHVLGKLGMNEVRSVERYDLALYEFAEQLFKQRIAVTECSPNNFKT
jgi:hypothetical protein